MNFPFVSMAFDFRIYRATLQQPCAIWDVSRRKRATMETQMEPLAVSINSAAKALGIGRSSIYSLIKEGRLEAIKIGRRTLLTTTSIKRLAQATSSH